MESTPISVRSPVADSDDGTKKIESVDVGPHISLKKRIERAVGKKKHLAEIEKDRRLIEAAIATEHRVISLDDLVGSFLRDHSSKLPEVQQICWVNPCTPVEHAIAWLEAGRRPIGLELSDMRDRRRTDDAASSIRRYECCLRDGLAGSPCNGTMKFYERLRAGP